MAQPSFTNGTTTYLLAYPQQYQETRIPRAADTISFTRYIKRLFPYGRGHYYRSISIGWDELEDAEFLDVQSAYHALAASDHGDITFFDWSFVTPAGVTLYHCVIDLKELDLAVIRFANPTAGVLYQTHFTFLAEEAS